MTGKTIDEQKAELAKLLEEASKQSATPQGAAGAFGAPNLWGMVASHLLDAMQRIVQDAIRQSQQKRP